MRWRCGVVLLGAILMGGISSAQASFVLSCRYVGRVEALDAKSASITLRVLDTETRHGSHADCERENKSVKSPVHLTITEALSEKEKVQRQKYPDRELSKKVTHEEAVDLSAITMGDLLVVEYEHFNGRSGDQYHWNILRHNHWIDTTRYGD